MNVCPCGSAEEYAACCGRYVDGAALAPTAEALMRSRYSAYTLGRVEYLNRTWHPRTRPPQLSLDDGVQWLGLSIVATERGQVGDAKGMVEFIARFRAAEGDQALQERSRFVCESGAWLYVDGVFPAAPAVGRNAPCPCGSGKKYKHCCGKG